MAGLNVQSFASLFAAKASGLQGAGGVQAVAKTNPFAAYQSDALANIQGDLRNPKGVQSTLCFGGRSELGPNSWNA